METIEVIVKVEKEIPVEVHVADVVAAMNELPMKKRWNTIGAILNQVQMDLTDLTPEHRAIIKKYLENKLEIFKQ